ncbi:MAG: hypothetical protein J5750_01680 [Clostridiales bacterium]|nr:hypothetical protein [Clostridiales bacterium]
MKNKKNENKGETLVRYYKLSEMTPSEMMEDFFAEEEKMKNEEEHFQYPVDEDGAPDFTKVTAEEMESGKCDEMIAEYIRRVREGEVFEMGDFDPNEDEEAWEEIKEKILILQEAWEAAEEEDGEV